ncbi:conserved hypothetical protein [Ricinus communis]|uniref:Uncharacterized protein n=1 Tax=Ricinus communis TaxID=3988 RepID=B9THW9_RICCO|nr:conserved hypothetical protein [Ricinus communis]
MRQHGDAEAGAARGQHRGRIVGPERIRASGDEFLQPRLLRRVLHRFAVADEFPFVVRPLEPAGRRIQAVTRLRQRPRRQSRLLGTRHAQREVGLSPVQVGLADFADDLQRERGPARAQRAQARHEEAAREGGRRRQPHDAAQGGSARAGTGKRERLVFDPARLRQQFLAFDGERPVLRQPVEQAHAQASLEHADAAGDGRMLDVQRARRRAQLALAGQFDEVADVIPVEWLTYRFLHGHWRFFGISDDF